MKKYIRFLQQAVTGGNPFRTKETDRHLTSRRSRAANICGRCHWLPENKGESCHVPGCRFYPPPA